MKKTENSSCRANKFKKILSIMIVSVIIICIVPGTVYAAVSGTKGGTKKREYSIRLKENVTIREIDLLFTEDKICCNK